MSDLSKRVAVRFAIAQRVVQRVLAYEAPTRDKASETEMQENRDETAQAQKERDDTVKPSPDSIDFHDLFDAGGSWNEVSTWLEHGSTAGGDLEEQERQPGYEAVSLLNKLLIETNEPDRTTE